MAPQPSGLGGHGDRADMPRDPESWRLWQNLAMVFALALADGHTSGPPARLEGGLPRKGSRLLTGIVAVLQLLVSLALIFLILLHAGRGGGVSDMFGGGMSSGNIAGSTVVERNLDRLTVIIAISFAVFTLWLTWLMA